jgi:hypothetical protein
MALSAETSRWWLGTFVFSWSCVTILNKIYYVRGSFRLFLCLGAVKLLQNLDTFHSNLLYDDLQTLEHGGRGFESRSRYWCMFEFFCDVPSCIGTNLTMGESHVQGVLPNCLKGFVIPEFNSESKQAIGSDPCNKVLPPDHHETTA